MMDSCVVFDFDGTLVDASERLYRLFQSLVPQSALTKGEYWRLKRDKIGHEQILRMFSPEVSFNEFESKWLSLIESSDYLKFDRPYDDAKACLENLAAAHDLILLTARQSRQALMQELEKYGWEGFFSSIYVTEGNCPKGGFLDELLTETDYPKYCLVGDTGADVEAGKERGMTTIALSHGFMSAEKLAGYHPDVIVDSLNDVVDILQSRLHT